MRHSRKSCPLQTFSGATQSIAHARAVNPLDQKRIVELAESGHPEKIGATQVMLTLFDGNIVFERTD